MTASIDSKIELDHAVDQTDFVHTGPGIARRAGRCVEQPAEAKPFCAKVRKLASYPTREAHGLVFAYLGEGEAPSFLPHEEAGAAGGNPGPRRDRGDPFRPKRPGRRGQAPEHHPHPGRGIDLRAREDRRPIEGTPGHPDAAVILLRKVWKRELRLLASGGPRKEFGTPEPQALRQEELDAMEFDA